MKIHGRTVKILFSRITRPISTKLGTKHSLVKGIQIYSDEGPSYCTKGDNYEKVKKKTKLENLSRTTGQISTELGTKHFG